MIYPPMKFRFFDHTADAKFRAYGKTVEEQFSNAALAMTAVMFDVGRMKGEVEEEIRVEGSDFEQLLYNWLEALLFLMDTKGYIMVKIKSLKIMKRNRQYHLKAEVRFTKWYESIPQKTLVKAATYAEMEITPEYVQVV